MNLSPACSHCGGTGVTRGLLADEARLRDAFADATTLRPGALVTPVTVTGGDCYTLRAALDELEALRARK